MASKIFRQLIQNIVTSGKDERIDIEVRRKTILINIICIIGIINLIPFGILALFNNNLTLGFFDLIVAAVLISILYCLRITVYHVFWSYFGVSFAGALFVYLFATGGVNNTGHLWYYTFPLVTSFLLGSKRGAIATSTLFILAILIFVVQDYSPIITTYSKSFIIRFITSFFVIFGLSFFYENTREKTQQQLAQRNAALEQTLDELRRAEKKQKDTSLLLESILNSIPDIIGIQDMNHEVIRYNEAGYKFLNLSSADVKGKKCFELIGRNMPCKICATSETYRTKKPAVIEKYLDEEEMWLDVRSYPILDEKGNITNVVEHLRNVTKTKLAEEAVRESEEKLVRSKKMESLGLLAGGVAHDLNNVLSGIVGYPELLLLDLPEDSKLRKPIEIIQESGHSATAIVQDLLTVARGIATTKEVLNLNDLIRDYLHSPEFNKLKQFHPTATVKTNLNTDLLTISGSPIHIRKVVMNLVSNSAEAIEGGGNVTISTANRYLDRPLRGYDDVNIGEYVILSVSDDGSGISSDDLERIFEPFYTKKIMGRSGTGLGLAVVWNTVQDHKGYIDVTSGENGTTFELYFPITRDEVSGKDLSRPIKDYQGNQEMVLVVDDMENQREISCKMLDKLGYKTKAVSSGEEAVEYLKENTVDLLLLDMIMDPGINGRETYERIIKIHPKQKAIIVSGFAQTDEVNEAQKLGAGQYIKKPVTLEKIGLAVKEELEK